LCAGLVAPAEQWRQRALSLVLSLCKQRKNRYSTNENIGNKKHHPINSSEVKALRKTEHRSKMIETIAE
jgi:hypothetical protein